MDTRSSGIYLLISSSNKIRRLKTKHAGMLRFKISRKDIQRPPEKFWLNFVDHLS